MQCLGRTSSKTKGRLDSHFMPRQRPPWRRLVPRWRPRQTKLEACSRGPGERQKLPQKRALRSTMTHISAISVVIRISSHLSRMERVRGFAARRSLGAVFARRRRGLQDLSCSGARIPIGMSVYCRASRRRGRRTPENGEFIGVRHALFGYHGRPGRTWTVGSMVRLFWTCRWANTVRSDLRRSCAAHALLTTGGAVLRNMINASSTSGIYKNKSRLTSFKVIAASLSSIAAGPAALPFMKGGGRNRPPRPAKGWWD